MTGFLIVCEKDEKPSANTNLPEHLGLSSWTPVSSQLPDGLTREELKQKLLMKFKDNQNTHIASSRHSSLQRPPLFRRSSCEGPTETKSEFVVRAIIQKNFE
jgi:hypothetical protein